MMRKVAAAVGRPHNVNNVVGGSEQPPAACLVRSTGRGRRESREEKAARYCNHCKRSGRTPDQCFKLIGYPEWYKRARDIGKGKVPMRATANVVG